MWYNTFMAKIDSLCRIAGQHLYSNTAVGTDTLYPVDLLCEWVSIIIYTAFIPKHSSKNSCNILQLICSVNRPLPSGCHGYHRREMLLKYPAAHSEHGAVLSREVKRTVTTRKEHIQDSYIHTYAAVGIE